MGATTDRPGGSALPRAQDATLDLSVNVWAPLTLLPEEEEHYSHQENTSDNAQTALSNQQRACAP